MLLYTNQLYYTILNFTSLYLYDYSLIEIFTNKARWYQLHFIINSIVVINILSKVLKILYDPINNYEIIDKKDTSNYLSNLHVCLHLYHLLFFKKLNFWDYFHHIIFTLLGIIPGILFINSNQLFLHKISCGGIPGIIEYSSLVLYKHNKITKYSQKKLNTFLYIFFRLPLCILGATYNILAYYYGYIKDPLWITIYVNTLLYLNGTIFTYLTVKSYFKLKYEKKM
tara:strand:+ start:3068 stop:3745 length:678 start_codon:yes stop_codon:yes gene_type:complete